MIPKRFLDIGSPLSTKVVIHKTTRQIRICNPELMGIQGGLTFTN